jgi:hypothetical protein
LTAVAVNAMAMASRIRSSSGRARKEAHAQWTLASLQHVANGIVDGGDVICIEGVPQAEHVRDESKSDECGIVRGIVQVQAPAERVQQGDESRNNPLRCSHSDGQNQRCVRAVGAFQRFAKTRTKLRARGCDLCVFIRAQGRLDAP